MTEHNETIKSDVKVVAVEIKEGREEIVLAMEVNDFSELIDTTNFIDYICINKDKFNIYTKRDDYRLFTSKLVNDNPKKGMIIKTISLDKKDGEEIKVLFGVVAKASNKAKEK